MADTSPTLLSIHWSENPFAELRKEMDHALERFFGKSKLFSRAAGKALLSCSDDRVESDMAVAGKTDLTGLSKDKTGISPPSLDDAAAALLEGVLAVIRLKKPGAFPTERKIAIEKQ